MATPTLSSISPASGPPGTAITCLGSGFDDGAQVWCPAAADTTFVSTMELTAEAPAGITCPAGGTVAVSVMVRNEDGSFSAAKTFTVAFPEPSTSLATYTTVASVCTEVPGFKRGGTRITDTMIEGWMGSIAQTIAGVMLRRGLSLAPADWQQADEVTGMPSAAGVLELINRYGAAARLASAIAGDFTSGEWGLAKNLQRDFERELKTLGDGGYDKLFRPAAATLDTDAQLSGGDIETDDGDAEQAFSKTQVF